MVRISRRVLRRDDEEEIALIRADLPTAGLEQASGFRIRLPSFTEACNLYVYEAKNGGDAIELPDFLWCVASFGGLR